MRDMFRRSVWAALILTCLSPAEGSADEAKRVLLLHSFGPRFSPFNSFSGEFRAELVGRSPSPLDIYEVSLEAARFSEDRIDDPFVGYLAALFHERRPDLVVPIGGAASRFAQAQRDRLFPDTPMLVAGVEERRLQANALTANDAALALRLDLPAAIENILQVLPETTKVFVVIGSSPLEKFWMQEASKEFKQFEDRLTFEWSSGLPFDEILRRAAALPTGAVVLYGVMVVDADGVPFEEDRALSRLHAAASAPIFGLFDSQIGKGIVGGSLVSVDELVNEAVDAALRILAGEPPAEIDVPPRELDTRQFDFRELERWEISEDRLPPDSIVMFREATIWEEYRWPIIGVILFCIVQTGFIVALLENRRRLSRAKSALRVSDDRLGLAASAAGLGLWVWDIAIDDVWITESGRKLFGWPSPDRVNFELFVEAAHPDDRALFRRAVQRAIDDKSDFETEYRVAMPGHPARWVASRGQVEFGSDGKPVRVRGVTIDITGRHEAEEDARELSGRLINAHEDERSRLARELHDDVTQRLAVLAIDAGRGERNALTQADGSAMHEMREGLVRLSEDVHSLSYRLHPSILEDLGLVDALQAECDHFSELERIPVEVEARDIPENLSPAVALCLFRVSQEALRNIGRHAGAARIRVCVRQVDRRLHLSVKDDGRGFDPERQRIKPSLGLASMRQRIELVGGRLSVESAAKHGTTILAWVPLQEEAYESTTHAAG